MKKRNKFSNSKSTVLNSLILFIIETIIITISCVIEFSILNSSDSVPQTKTLLAIGFALVAILITSLLLLLFIRQFSYDKKILVTLGFITIALGILGYSDLLIKNNLSIIDAVYRTFQLFVGEFNDIPHEPGKFPLMLNVSRFLALFVTFGTIAVLLLREKITQMNIHFFYRDVVIITNEIDRTITSLAGRLNEAGRKVIIGLVKPIQDAKIKSNDFVPIIEFDIEKSIYRGLHYCNIKNSGCIYLLCDDTSDNIMIFSAIRNLNNRLKPTASTGNPANPTDIDISPDDLIDRFYKLLHKDLSYYDQDDNNKESVKKCFIKYNSSAEKEYFSNDTGLITESNFETYFINPNSNALRQMISRLDLWNIINQPSLFTSDSICDALENIKIGISGSGPLLENTIEEIIRLCTFNTALKPEFYLISSPAHPETLLSDSTKLKYDSIITLNHLNIDLLPDQSPALNLLFICSQSEIRIKSFLHKIFQSRLHMNLKEIIILTEDNLIEYNLLKKYILNLRNNCLISDQKSELLKTNIYLGNKIDLLTSIDEFYNIFGPDIRLIHNSYKNSISNGLLNDINRLPEELIESNLLASIHNQLILDMLKKAVDNISTEPFIYKKNLKEILWYLAQAEHERWYKERLTQGYIYAENHDYFLNKNPNLKHWIQLPESMKEKNYSYLLNALLIQLQKHKSYDSAEYIESLITTIHFYPGERKVNQ